MKAIVIVLGALMLNVAAFSQRLSNDKVPAAVKAGFKAKYPSVKSWEWEKESASKYEADFKLKNRKHSAIFDRSGKWIETETEIGIAALPKAVTHAIAKQFPGFKIKEAEKAITSNNVTLYEVAIQKGTQSYTVHLSADGQVLSKESEKD